MLHSGKVLAWEVRYAVVYKFMPMTGHKVLRVMCDYGAHGLWLPKGAVHPADLPLPGPLVQAILDWQASYEAMIEAKDETGWEAFSARGLQIAIAIKRALPAWQVIYFDEDRRDIAAAFDWPAEGPWRAFFEYEVDAAVLASGQPPVWAAPAK